MTHLYTKLCDECICIGIVNDEQSFQRVFDREIFTKAMVDLAKQKDLTCLNPDDGKQVRKILKSIEEVYHAGAHVCGPNDDEGGLYITPQGPVMREAGVAIGKDFKSDLFTPHDEMTLPGKVAMYVESVLRADFENDAVLFIAKVAGSMKIKTAHIANAKQHREDFEADLDFPKLVPQIFDGGKVLRLHINWSFAMAMACPLRNIFSHNLLMDTDVLYQTNMDGLLQWCEVKDMLDKSDEDLREFSVELDTWGVQIVPLTVTLLGTLVKKTLGYTVKLHNAKDDIENTVYFKRSKPLVDPKNEEEAVSDESRGAITVFLWAATRHAKKILRMSCHNCCRSRRNGGVKFLCCGGCKRVYYCSAACQTAGWPWHRDWCHDICQEVGDRASFS